MYACVCVCVCVCVFEVSNVIMFKLHETRTLHVGFDFNSNQDFNQCVLTSKFSSQKYFLFSISNKIYFYEVP